MEAGPDPRDPSVHPKVLQNEDPAFLASGFGSVVQFLQTYGWFLLLGFVVYLYFKEKIHKQIASAQTKVDTVRENASYDAEAVRRRQEAMDEARRRLQEKYDQDAARFAEKQQQKEEAKRQEKIDDWERHKQGKGYRSKYKPGDEPSSSGPSGTSKTSTAKKVYRDNDYSPLMGGGGVSGFRPARRSGGGTRGG